MKDIIAYIKLEITKENVLTLESDGIITDNNDDDHYAKQINLTEIIIGFAEFAEGYSKIDQIYIKNEDAYKHQKDWILFTNESLLEIYLKEKGIITE